MASIFLILFSTANIASFSGCMWSSSHPQTHMPEDEKEDGFVVLSAALDV